jgi:hypothetical protein
MTVRFSTSAARSMIAIACTAVTLAFLPTGVGGAQGTSGTDAQISALKQQVNALERRVTELQIATASVDTAKIRQDEAKIMLLEGQISQLQVEVRGLGADAADSGRQKGTQSASKIVAPFVVVDRAGKVVMRVSDEGGGLSRGVYFYNKNEAVVSHMGATPDGSGRVYVTMNGALPMAMMAISGDGPIFRLGAGTQKAVEIDKSSMVFYSDGGSPLSLFGTKARGKGYMELNNSGGSKMVEAGMLNAGVGYVMANPSRSSVSINGNPSVLMGGAGR